MKGVLKVGVWVDNSQLCNHYYYIKYNSANSINYYLRLCSYLLLFRICGEEKRRVLEKAGFGIFSRPPFLANFFIHQKIEQQPGGSQRISSQNIGEPVQPERQAAWDYAAKGRDLPSLTNQ
jgi:hypothetical protein